MSDVSAAKKSPERDKVGLGDRLRQLRARHQLSREAFAARAGIGVNSLRRYESGERSPTAEVLKKISDAFSLSPEYLLSGDTSGVFGGARRIPFDELVREEPVKIVRLATRPEGGTDTPIEDWIEGRVFLSREDLELLQRTEKQLVTVRVDGDSMEPTIKAGDEVIVDVDDRRLRDGIWVIAMSGYLVATRLQVRPDGTARMLSDNDKYPPVELGGDPAGPLTQTLQIVGRVLRIRMREP